MISHSNKVVESGIELNSFPAELCTRYDLLNITPTTPLRFTFCCPTQAIIHTSLVDLRAETKTSLGTLTGILCVEGISENNYLSCSATDIYKNNVSIYTPTAGTYGTFCNQESIRLYNKDRGIAVSVLDAGATGTLWVHLWDGNSFSTGTSVSLIADTTGSSKYCAIDYLDSDTAIIAVVDSTDDYLELVKYVFSTNTATKLYSLSLGTWTAGTMCLSAFDLSNIFINTLGTIYKYDGSTISVFTTTPAGQIYGMTKKDRLLYYFDNVNSYIYSYDIDTATETIIQDYQMTSASILKLVNGYQGFGGLIGNPALLLVGNSPNDIISSTTKVNLRTF